MLLVTTEVVQMAIYSFFLISTGESNVENLKRLLTQFKELEAILKKITTNKIMQRQKEDMIVKKKKEKKSNDLKMNN